MATPRDDPGETLRAYLVAGDAGDDTGLREHLAVDVVTHAPGGVTLTGVEAQVQAWASARSGLGGLKHEVVDVVTSGDRAAALVRVTGKHDGRFLGIEPTGAEVSVDQAIFVRCVNGQIQEMWEVVDTGVGLQQLGAIGDQALSPGS